MAYQQGPEAWLSKKDEQVHPSIFDGVENPKVMGADTRLFEEFDNESNRFAELKNSGKYHKNQISSEEQTGLA